MNRDAQRTELVQATDVSVSYDTVRALQSVSFSVTRGEFVAIIGPNGAGKSTLCDALSGYQDYRGSIRYLGREVRAYEAESADDRNQRSDGSILGRVPGLAMDLLRGGRSPIADGLVYCSETRNLFGNMSVENNLELGAYRRKDRVDDRREFVYQLFPDLDDRRDQLVRTLSGGQQQMVAIGRALMGDPRVLVLDEPTIGLAPVICDDIAEALDQVRADGTTIVLLEQNVTFAMDLADRVLLMENGEFVREGSPDDLQDDDYIQEVYLGG